MGEWKINRIFYYEVNNKKFDNKEDAEEYALKLFLVGEIDKLFDKEGYNNYSIYIDDDNKTIVVHIAREPIIDDWNVGHYGCTEPKVIDKSEDKKYKTIQEFCERYSSLTKKLIEISDSINVDSLELICDEEIINEIVDYKDMVEKLKNAINYESK